MGSEPTCTDMTLRESGIKIFLVRLNNNDESKWGKINACSVEQAEGELRELERLLRRHVVRHTFSSATPSAESQGAGH